MPIVAVFVDGLKPESLEHMEFLNTLYHVRVKTELGAYSPVCHTSIYTGVFPNKHLCWFTWKYSPESSPFQILNRIGVSHFPHNIYSQYLCYKICLMRSDAANPFIFGFSVFTEIPMKYWCYFDTDIKRPFTEPNFYNRYPNLFELLRLNEVKYEVIGTTKRDQPFSSESVKKHELKKDIVFTLYFIGDIDPLSHSFCQDSEVCVKRLKLIDKIMEEKYRDSQKIFKSFYFIVFSDHGHSEVKNTINLREIFRRRNRDLARYIHFTDSNYARFWFRNSKEEEDVRKVLYELEEDGLGFILTEKHFNRYHVDMPDNRYGDIIFYLDKPNVFMGKEISALGKKVERPVSMHGYLPDYPDSDGVFISNMRLKKDRMILQDIAPSILQALGLETPKYIDGEPVWK
ncbi:MAG: alkaline phosphatase family protein [Candidatus Aenigmatarchaeota archaeon]